MQLEGRGPVHAWALHSLKLSKFMPSASTSRRPRSTNRVALRTPKNEAKNGNPLRQVWTQSTTRHNCTTSACLSWTPSMIRRNLTSWDATSLRCPDSGVENHSDQARRNLVCPTPTPVKLTNSRHNHLPAVLGEARGAGCSPISWFDEDGLKSRADGGSSTYARSHRSQASATRQPPPKDPPGHLRASSRSRKSRSSHVRLETLGSPVSRQSRCKLRQQRRLCAFRLQFWQTTTSSEVGQIFHRCLPRSQLPRGAYRACHERVPPHDKGSREPVPCSNRRNTDDNHILDALPVGFCRSPD